jgi:hypothetical protein
MKNHTIGQKQTRNPLAGFARQGGPGLPGLILTLIALGAFALAGCTNPLAPPEQTHETGGNTSVLVRIGSAGARTLLPQQNFTKYVLTFSTTAQNVSIPGPVTLTGTNAGVINLDPADWTIDVIGYVSINGQEYEAARGQGSALTTMGQQEVVDITLSASITGDDGYFTWTVDTSAATRVTSATLSIDNTIKEGDLQSNLTDTVPLAPGYHLLKVELRTEYGIAVRTEVVHIYSNMETLASYVFTDDDFGKIITLSGTMDLSGLMVTPGDTAYIGFHTDPGFNYWIDDITDYDLSANSGWSIELPAFAQKTDVYIHIWMSSDSIDRRIANPIPGVYQEDVGNIVLGPFDNNTITLNGTAGFSNIAPGEIDYAELSLTTPSGFYVGGTSIDPDTGDWSIDIPPFAEPTDLQVELRLYAGGSDFSTILSNPISGVHNANKNAGSLGTVPVYRLDLGGTLSFSGLSSVSLHGASIRIMTEDLYNELSSVWVQPTDQSWSTTVFSFEPLPENLRALLDVPLSSALRIYEGRGVTVSGSSAFGINFAPASLTAGTWHDREFNSNYLGGDYFLFVPGTSGQFNLAVENIGSGQMYPGIIVYNAGSGSPVGSAGGSNPNALELNAHLASGQPYIVMVGGNNNGAYRFRVSPVTSGTISGTIDFSNLNLSFDSVVNAAIRVYRADTLQYVTDIQVSPSGGAWSDSIYAPADLDLYFVLDAELVNGLHVHDTRTITGNTTGINFTPRSIDAGTTYTGKAIGYEGQYFLFVPAQSGSYTLDAITALGSSMNTYLHLYDGANGTQLPYDDNGGGTLNARITYTLVGGHPYIIRVKDNNNRNGTFLLRVAAPGMAPTPMITLSGTLNLNYTDIISTSVGIYSRDYDQSYVAGSGVNPADGTWSVTIPPFTNPTDLYLRFDVGMNSSWFSKNALILTGVEGQDIPDIDLGTFTIASLSGTLSSVLVDDDPELPYSVQIFAAAGGEDVGSTEPAGDGTWDMDVVIPQGAGDISFAVAAGNGQYQWVLWQTNVSIPAAAGTITGINLEDITILTTEISGTVKSGSQPSGHVLALSAPVGITDIRPIIRASISSSKVVGTGVTTYSSGTWRLAIPATAPEYLWFAVIDNQYSNVYITPAPQSTSAPVTLNTSQMTLLGPLF